MTRAASSERTLAQATTGGRVTSRLAPTGGARPALRRGARRSAERVLDLCDRSALSLVPSWGGRRDRTSQIEHERAVGVQLSGCLRLKQLRGGTQRLERPRLDLVGRSRHTEAGAVSFRDAT